MTFINFKKACILSSLTIANILPIYSFANTTSSPQGSEIVKPVNGDSPTPQGFVADTGEAINGKAVFEVGDDANSNFYTNKGCPPGYNPQIRLIAYNVDNAHCDAIQMFHSELANIVPSSGSASRYLVYFTHNKECSSGSYWPLDVHTNYTLFCIPQ